MVPEQAMLRGEALVEQQGALHARAAWFCHGSL
jgi:hypothetical protein